MLPKINYPTISIIIPPAKKATNFRPMLVREEKLLLMAKLSEDPTDILQAIKQVVNNCCLDPNFNVNRLPLFALELCPRCIQCHTLLRLSLWSRLEWSKVAARR